MNLNINKMSAFMSVLISLLIAVYAELFILSAVIYLPKHKGLNYITSAMWHPIDLINIAKNGKDFKPFQLLMVAGVVFLSVKIYKLFVGNGYKQASEYGAHGTARFATPKEIFNGEDFVKDSFYKKRNPEKNLENPSGLIMGMVKKKPLISPYTTPTKDAPNRHVLTVGAPDAGKTQSYILTNIIFETERSMVATDPKGELYEKTARLKKQQGYEVRVINFKEMAFSDRYNPLDYIMKEIDAEQVATTIVLNSMQGEHRKIDFWNKAEISLLKTLLLYVKYEMPADANLFTVKKILTVYCNTPKKMEQFFKRLPVDHPAYSSYLNVRMAQEKVRDSIFVSLAMTLSKFEAQDVRRFTEMSDFLLDDIARKKMIVYVILPVADSTWEPLTANFFTQMFQRFYAVADRNFNKLPVPVNLLLDEFPNLGTIPGYEEILATIRSYGVSVSTIVQSLGQLIDMYNKEKTDAIVNNCRFRLLLGVGDNLTAEYFSKTMGPTTIQTHSSSTSKNPKGGSDSKSENYTGRELKKLDEIIRTDRDKAYLLVSGCNPIEIEKAYQYKLFKGILNEDNKISRFNYIELIDDYQEIQVPEAIVQNEEAHTDKIEESVQERASDMLNIMNESNVHEPEVAHEELHPEFYRPMSNPVKVDNLKEYIAAEIQHTDNLIKDYDKKAFEAKKNEQQKKKEFEQELAVPLFLNDDDGFRMSLPVETPEEPPVNPDYNDVPVQDDDNFSSLFAELEKDKIEESPEKVFEGR